VSATIQKQFDELLQLITLAKFIEALDLVEKISKIKGINKKDQLDCLLFRSEIEYFLGNYKESLQVAEKALKESKEIDNSELIIKSLYWKSSAFHVLGKINKCLELIEESLKLMADKDLLENPALDRIRIRSTGLKGVIIANSGNYKTGLEKIQQAIDMAEQSNDKQIFAHLTTHLGLYTLFSGDIEKAEKILKRAQKISKDLGNKQEIAMATMRMGVLKTHKQEYKEALELYFRSIELSNETGSTHLYFATYMNIGEVYKALFQLDDAIENLKKALTFQSGYTFMINTNLAEIYYWKNDLDLALKYFLDALKKSKEIKDRRYNPNILYQIINLYIQKKLFNEAQQYLNQLEKIRNEEKLKQYDEFYTISVIQFHKASTNVQDWSKAVEFAEDFLTRKDIQVDWRLDILYIILEIRLRELQINANEESLVQVRKQIDEVFQEAEEMKQYNVVVNLYKLKAQLALVELDIKSAIEFLVTARTIAKEKDLELLVQEIIREEKKLEEQISMWTKFQEQNLPLVDTLKQVSLENTVQEITKDAIVEVSDENCGTIIEYRKLFALKI